MAAAALGAAGLTAVSGLLGELLRQQAEREALPVKMGFEREMLERRQRAEQEEAARNRVGQAQQMQLATAQRAGQTEQDAIAQLIAAFERSKR